MHLSKVSELVLYWKILDSDKNLFGGVLVVWIHLRHEIFSYTVENR